MFEQSDSLKRIKISGCAGGLPAILCFSIVPWKNTLSTCHPAGRYAIISCANLLTQGPLHGMFLLLISKPAFYRWLNFAISWRLYNRRNGLPKHLLSTSHCFAEDVAMTKDCMLLRYQIYILTSCEFVDDLQMGVSIDFWESWICTCRFPYCFVVFQQVSFVTMVSMLLHSCAWIGLLTSIVRTCLCQNAPGEIWITKPYEQYKHRSETPRERPKLLA